MHPNPPANLAIPIYRLGDKKKMYKSLAEQYFLPPRDSYGLTLQYLQKVQTGSVFRVETAVLHRFLAELKASELKRAVYTCKFEAYDKIDRLLRERDEPGLGFDSGLLPNGSWLYRVARYLDPSNVCGLFEVALQAEGNEGDAKTDSERLQRAQRRAEKEVIGDTGLGKRPEIKSCLAELAQSHKRLVSLHAEHANHLSYGAVLEKRVREARAAVERELGISTVLVYQAGKGVSAEEASLSGDEKKREVHQILSFVYATDCVLDRSDEVGSMAKRFW